MDKATVALVRCDDYDEDRVYAAVSQGVSLLGGMERFIQKDEAILLKPNLLNKALPQKAVTTHPFVFSAVARLLKEQGYQDLSYGDSPGNPTTTPQQAAMGCGIAPEAERWGIRAADFNSGSLTRNPQGSVAHSFMLCNGAKAAQAIINLPKMKTHALERITGAMKNLYGCVFSVNKAAGHVHYPDSWLFADMLAELALYLRPRLHIMDGIIAMEGNGPTSGTPVKMGVMLFSQDPVALDSVYASLLGLDPHDIPTCESGARAGVGVMEPESIEVITPDGTLTVENATKLYGNPNFDVFRGKMKKGVWCKFLPLMPFLQERPKVDQSLCIACGICEKACPVPSKAVVSGNGKKAKYDYQKCIRCYCCQEMCPAKAIRVHRSGLNRLFNKK